MSQQRWRPAGQGDRRRRLWMQRLSHFWRSTGRG